MSDGSDTTQHATNDHLTDDRAIVLTGFMGTGKTTVGRVLAERLGYELIDTDKLIEADHGPIPQIFAERGEDAFRALERDVARTLAGRRRVVIATGGRLMLDRASAEALGNDAHVFCLRATAERIIARLTASQGRTERPLLATADPASRIRELLAERADGYGRFEQIDTDGRPPDAVAATILARLGGG